MAEITVEISQWLQDAVEAHVEVYALDWWARSRGIEDPVCDGWRAVTVGGQESGFGYRQVAITNNAIPRFYLRIPMSNVLWDLACNQISVPVVVDEAP